MKNICKQKIKKRNITTISKFSATSKNMRDLHAATPCIHEYLDK